MSFFCCKCSSHKNNFDEDKSPVPQSPKKFTNGNVYIDRGLKKIIFAKKIIRWISFYQSLNALFGAVYVWSMASGASVAVYVSLLLFLQSITFGFCLRSTLTK